MPGLNNIRNQDLPVPLVHPDVEVIIITPSTQCLIRELHAGRGTHVLEYYAQIAVQNGGSIPGFASSGNGYWRGTYINEHTSLYLANMTGFNLSDPSFSRQLFLTYISLLFDGGRWLAIRYMEGTIPDMSNPDDSRVYDGAHSFACRLFGLMEAFMVEPYAHEQDVPGVRVPRAKGMYWADTRHDISRTLEEFEQEAINYQDDGAEPGWVQAQVNRKQRQIASARDTEMQRYINSNRQYASQRDHEQIHRPHQAVRERKSSLHTEESHLDDGMMSSSLDRPEFEQRVGPAQARSYDTAGGPGTSHMVNGPYAMLMAQRAGRIGMQGVQSAMSAAQWAQRRTAEAMSSSSQLAQTPCAAVPDADAHERYQPVSSGMQAHAGQRDIRRRSTTPEGCQNTNDILAPASTVSSMDIDWYAAARSIMNVVVFVYSLVEFEIRFLVLSAWVLARRYVPMALNALWTTAIDATKSRPFQSIGNGPATDSVHTGYTVHGLTSPDKGKGRERGFVGWHGEAAPTFSLQHQSQSQQQHLAQEYEHGNFLTQDMADDDDVDNCL